MNSIPQKRCTKCGKEYPATLEHFLAHKNTRDRLHPECHDCRRQNLREYYARNRERLVQYARDRRKKESDKVHAQQREGRKRNRDKIYRRNKDYVARNPDKARAWYRDYTHTAKGKARTHRRYAREKSLPADFTDKDWVYALEYWDGCCAICGRPRGFWHKIVPDHWIPLSDPCPDNPGTVRTNILPLCHGQGGCNDSKSNHEPTSWLIKKLGAKKAKKKLAEILQYFQEVGENG